MWKKIKLNPNVIPHTKVVDSRRSKMSVWKINSIKLENNTEEWLYNLALGKDFLNEIVCLSLGEGEGYDSGCSSLSTAEQ